MTEKPFALSLKAVVLDDRGRCLLLKRSMQSKNNPGKWDFPGGKLGRDESFDAGLLREIAEETGLRVKLERVIGTAQSESPQNRIVYLIMEARLESGEVRLSDEHEEFIWVDAGALPDVDITEQLMQFAIGYARSRTHR